MRTMKLLAIFIAACGVMLSCNKEPQMTSTAGDTEEKTLPYNEKITVYTKDKDKFIVMDISTDNPKQIEFMKELYEGSTLIVENFAKDEESKAKMLSEKVSQNYPEEIAAKYFGERDENSVPDEVVVKIHFSDNFHADKEKYESVALYFEKNTGDSKDTRVYTYIVNTATFTFIASQYESIAAVSFKNVTSHRHLQKCYYTFLGVWNYSTQMTPYWTWEFSRYEEQVTKEFPINTFNRTLCLTSCYGKFVLGSLFIFIRF